MEHTYESDLQVFINLVEQGEATIWAQATWAMEMAGRHGRKTTKVLATDTGFSASYVRQMVATAKVFPTPESRAQDLSFTHHRLAAMTQDPEKWLQESAEKGYSIADLRHAISDTKDHLTEFERARRAAEHLVNAMNRYNEIYAPILGKTASLVFNKIQAKSA